MDLNKNDAAIGAFVLGSMAVFLAAVVGINRARFTVQTYPLFITLPHIAGIDKGVDVMYQGYKAGSVDQIAISYHPKFRFVVRLAIKNEIELHQGTSVIVRSRGFTGGRYLELSPTEEGRLIQQGETLPTRLDNDLMSKANEVMGDMQTAFRKLQKEGTAEDLSQAIKHANHALAKLDSTLTHLNAMLEENRAPLKKTLESTSGIAEKTDRLLTKREAELEQTLENVNKSLKDVPAIMTDVKGLVSDLKRHPWRLLRKGDPPAEKPVVASPAEKKP
jgi:ABC-type transporter Mla subunit MlaD